MKGKAGVDKDFVKVSPDLLAAMASAQLSSRDLRIICWLKANTYGLRDKDGDKWVPRDSIMISHSAIHASTGIHRSRVKETIERLIKDRILRKKTNGTVGINSHLSQWTCPFQGEKVAKVSQGQSVPGPIRPKNGPIRPKTVANSAQNSGQSVPGSQNARGESVELRERERAAGAANGPPKALLPNGLADTPRNRGKLGDIHFDPDDHPQMEKLDFKVQRDIREDWELGWKATAEAARKKYSDEYHAKIAEERKNHKPVTPEEALAIRKKYWPASFK